MNGADQWTLIWMLILPAASIVYSVIQATAKAKYSSGEPQLPEGCYAVRNEAGLWVVDDIQKIAYLIEETTTNQGATS